ncbi:MAG TPA: hypothetical protein VND15_02870 [Candidatus Acidoferrales bacterium]|nr:hypothetical protein [Candidatus Acidoferrales bacterium]
MTDKRPTRVIFLDQAKMELEMLNKVVGDQAAKKVKNSEEMRLLKSITQKVVLIKANPLYGNNIPKRLIPHGLDVGNLFRVELTSYWRLLYTLRGNEVEVVAIVLYLIDHKGYDKILGYKSR